MALSDSLLYVQATNKTRNNLIAFLNIYLRIAVGPNVIPGGNYEIHSLEGSAPQGELMSCRGPERRVRGKAIAVIGRGGP
jgi:hypothetical protein